MGCVNEKFSTYSSLHSQRSTSQQSSPQKSSIDLTLEQQLAIYQFDKALKKVVRVPKLKNIQQSSIITRRQSVLLF
ncbi:hypothetical protein pb186bvf_018469 [Paramecium bursaria]